jgi:hypothetical protein
MPLPAPPHKRFDFRRGTCWTRSRKDQNILGNSSSRGVGNSIRGVSSGLSVRAWVYKFVGSNLNRCAEFFAIYILLVDAVATHIGRQNGMTINRSNRTNRTPCDVCYRASYQTGEEWAAKRANSEAVELMVSFGRSKLGIVRASPRGRVDLESEMRLEAITLMKKCIKTIGFFESNPIYDLNILGFYNGLRKGTNKRHTHVRSGERPICRSNSKHIVKSEWHRSSLKGKHEPLVENSDSVIAGFTESDIRDLDAFLNELDWET